MKSPEVDEVNPMSTLPLQCRQRRAPSQEDVSDLLKDPCATLQLQSRPRLAQLRRLVDVATDGAAASHCPASSMHVGIPRAHLEETAS